MGRTTGAKTLTPPVFRLIKAKQARHDQSKVSRTQSDEAIKEQFGYGATVSRAIRRTKTFNDYQDANDQRAKQRLVQRVQADKKVDSPYVTREEHDLAMKTMRRDMARLERNLGLVDERQNRVVTWVRGIDHRTSRSLLPWRNK